MSRHERRFAARLARAEGWTPFERGPMPDPRVFPGLDLVTSTWKNSTYSVLIAEHATAWVLVKQLQVRRHDGQPIRSWMDMQRVKNELAGEDALGIEVYPPASEVVDMANIYHLWILPPGFQFPFSL